MGDDGEQTPFAKRRGNTTFIFWKENHETLPLIDIQQGVAASYVDLDALAPEHDYVELYREGIRQSRPRNAEEN